MVSLFILSPISIFLPEVPLSHLPEASREGPCPDNQPSRLLRYLTGGTLWEPPSEHKRHTGEGVREPSSKTQMTRGDKAEHQEGGRKRPSPKGGGSAASVWDGTMPFQLPIPRLLNFSRLPRHQQDWVDNAFATGRGPMYRFVPYAVPLVSQSRRVAVTLTSTGLLPKHPRTWTLTWDDPQPGKSVTAWRTAWPIIKILLLVRSVPSPCHRTSGCRS